ncbi:hypothetical protein M0R72_21960 [Candidatus Pacearchaeota archaeon]|jgi:hypothetical protein|nr:hypothetical protein [Candidatus Pacearchaeota archaeon]
MTEEAKFTQADVDRFVADRLKIERERRGDNEKLIAENASLREQLATEQQTRAALEGKVALRDEADLKAKIAKEENLPLTLLPLITGKTEEEMRAAMRVMVVGIGPGPAIGAETNPAVPAPVRYTRAQLDQMKPEDIEKNWKTIEAQLADGSLR